MADDTSPVGGKSGPGLAARAPGDGDQAAHQLRAAKALQRFSNLLISEPDRDALYSEILHAAMEITAADAARLQIFDPARNGLELVKYENLHPVSARFWRRIGADSETGCGRALGSDERVVLANIEMGSSPDDENIIELQRNGLRARQSTPLRSRSGRLLGMLSTHWRQPLPHTEPDFTLLDVLARLAADVLDRITIEATLRQGEAREAFLLRLGDALRPLSDSVSIQEEATRLLGEYLDVGRCFYVEIDLAGGRYIVHRDHVRGAEPSLAAVYPVENWPLVTRALESGEPISIADTSSSPLITAEESVNLAAMNVGSVAAATLIKHGRFIAALAVTETGRREWTQWEIDLIEEVAERTWSAVERARAEQRQKLLMAELQHRVRNILATVRSIIQRTSQSSTTLEELSMHLEGRVDSMARAQVALTRNPGAGVDLEDLVREELLSQAVSESQVSIDGPEVKLSPKAAEVLNLVVHELATNSIKYGALTGANGRIVIAWTLNHRDGQPWLRFAWIESGVRIATAAPRREGFGSELITRRVPYELGGMGAFDLKPGGIHCIVEFPLFDRESILGTDVRGLEPD